MMACAFQRHYLGNDWRKSSDIEKTRSDKRYCQIVQLFLDFVGSPQHMFGIHNLVQCGVKYDKLPGEWFGPSTAALVLRFIFLSLY